MGSGKCALFFLGFCDFVSPSRSPRRGDTMAIGIMDEVYSSSSPVVAKEAGEKGPQKTRLVRRSTGEIRVPLNLFNSSPRCSSCVISDQRHKAMEKSESSFSLGNVDADVVLHRGRGGFLMGGVCGTIFGIQDAVKAVSQSSPVSTRSSAGLTGMSSFLSFLKNRALWAPAARASGITGINFAVFFSVYHMSLKTAEMARGEDDVFNFVAGVGVGLLPVIRSKPFRKSAPWALLLVGMDVFSHVANNLGYLKGKGAQRDDENW